MKGYLLITIDSFTAIARYQDAVADVFPVRDMPSLTPLKDAADKAFSSVEDAGAKGQYHSKLDDLLGVARTMLEEVKFLAGKQRLVQDIVGPGPYQGKVELAEKIRAHVESTPRAQPQDLLEGETMLEFDELPDAGS